MTAGARERLREGLDSDKAKGREAGQRGKGKRGRHRTRWGEDSFFFRDSYTNVSSSTETTTTTSCSRPNGTELADSGGRVTPHLSATPFGGGLTPPDGFSTPSWASWLLHLAPPPQNIARLGAAGANHQRSEVDTVGHKAAALSAWCAALQFEGPSRRSSSFIREPKL